ncbi:hypothetical protein OKW21_003458 [Catalinimonas alkaloidigena]|nr:hypothetical protein [Catalinimonas alkaloidigena]
MKVKGNKAILSFEIQVFAIKQNKDYPPFLLVRRNSQENDARILDRLMSKESF